jgi:hypothetical protein
MTDDRIEKIEKTLAEIKALLRPQAPFIPAIDQPKTSEQV